MTVLLDPTSERSPTVRPRLPRPERLEGLTIGILAVSYTHLTLPTKA